MVQYRLYTEDKNRDKIEKLISESAFHGFTIFTGDGYWKDLKEKSLVIEVIGSGSYLMTKNVRSLAEKIKALNSQESVLVTLSQVADGFFV